VQLAGSPQRHGSGVGKVPGLLITNPPYGGASAPRRDVRISRRSRGTSLARSSNGWRARHALPNTTQSGRRRRQVELDGTLKDGTERRFPEAGRRSESKLALHDGDLQGDLSRRARRAGIRVRIVRHYTPGPIAVAWRRPLRAESGSPGTSMADSGQLSTLIADGGSIGVIANRDASRGKQNRQGECGTRRVEYRASRRRSPILPDHFRGPDHRRRRRGLDEPRINLSTRRVPPRREGRVRLSLLSSHTGIAYRRTEGRTDVIDRFTRMILDGLLASRKREKPTSRPGWFYRDIPFPFRRGSRRRRWTSSVDLGAWRQIAWLHPNMGRAVRCREKRANGPVNV